MVSTDAAPPPSPSFWQAMRFWLKLGFVSFGGPAGQIALMHTELVERRRWISEKRFLHALNYCMVLPGPEAQQLATYIGWLLHRTWGGVVAGSLFVLPSLLVLVGLSWVYVRFGDVPWVAGLLYGLKPAVTALVLHAAVRIGRRVLTNRWMLAIAAASFVAVTALNVAFPVVLLAAALLGSFGSQRWPHAFVQADTEVAAGSRAGPAVVDDSTPPSPHTRFTRRGLARVMLVGLGLWGLGMACLVAVAGWEGTLTHMARFFTQAALMTFGGAYAVLPYVVEGAVVQHQWLSASQMMDGLALGETTPGPLIMVVAFVGFLGGSAQQVAGPGHPFLGGALAACVVTFFTFLPSFVLILAGGPLVERTRGKLALTAPLSAITAAVVGVILNLAAFFAGHVLWPSGVDGGFDLVAAALVALSVVALLRFDMSVPLLLGGCALAGLLLRSVAMS